MRCNGGALYFALIFSLIIAIFSGMLVLFAYYNKLQLVNYQLNAKLLSNLHSGFELVKSNNFSKQTTTLSLFNAGDDSVLIKKGNWSLFDLYSVKAFHSSKSIEKTALVGTTNSMHKKTGLYLQNSSNYPLSICGNTTLKGNTYLTKAGVKRANIEGKNYIGSQLIYGNTFLSEKELPILNENTLKYLKQMSQFIFLDEKSENLENLNIDTINHSFTLNSLLINYSQIKQTTFSLIKGNVIIYDKEKIVIEKNSNYENIILVAPIVIVNNDVQGTFHIIASDSIYIGEKVILNYPSSICLISEKPAKIDIASLASIKGEILLEGKNTFQQKSLLTIAENAFIEGNIYCNGNVSHRAKIYGSLFCHSFYLKTPSAIYENHLLDAIIDPTARAEKYGAGFMFQENVNKKVIAWF
jgi:hypothetical protein